MFLQKRFEVFEMEETVPFFLYPSLTLAPS